MDPVTEGHYGRPSAFKRSVFFNDPDRPLADLEIRKSYSAGRLYCHRVVEARFRCLEMILPRRSLLRASLPLEYLQKLSDRNLTQLWAQLFSSVKFSNLDGAGWCRMVPDGAGWCRMVLDGSGWLWLDLITLPAFRKADGRSSTSSGLNNSTNSEYTHYPHDRWKFHRPVLICH